MQNQTSALNCFKSFRFFNTALLASGLLAAVGCGSSGDRDDSPAPRTSGEPIVLLDAPIMSVAVDGKIDDWPSTASAVADQHYLYIRFKTDRLATIQADNETIQVQLDLDANRATGQADSRAELGIDLAITFSPLDAEGQPSFGSRVETFRTNGDVVQMPAAALDIMSAPTHASEWFELRVGRHVIEEFAQDLALPTAGLLSQGSVRGRVALFGAGGRLLASADPFEVDLAPAADGPRRVRASVPDKSLGSVRLVAYNVENSSPVNNPEPFTRMLRAIEPDVICVQEWYDQTPASLEAWFNEQLPISGTWRAFTSEGRGVAVVTRFDATAFGPDAVIVTPEGEDRTVRVASALLDTPAGSLVVSSVHLKCCGSLGGREDMLRSAEAAGIADMLQQQLADPSGTAVVIAGDYNLVGGTAPLETMVAGLDSDGSDLGVVDARGLGDPTMYTWTQPTSSFLPGRLDYVAYSDARLGVERSFVFDPARLDAESRGSLNLGDTDGRASDHLPIVVDFRPR
ncbi:MAG: endonuclease/exonuclease/phosphatase family protein [Planctomycetota bacterium]